MSHYCSLRGLQQASTLKKVQKKFGISKTSLGSLSESVRIFDPERLKQIAKELGDQLPKVQHRHISTGSQTAKLEQLSSLGKTITAVDGSFVPILARIANLAWIQVGDGSPTCGYRLHTQFEILKGIPHRIDATSANPKGQDGERAVLERTLESDRLYVTDRSYQKWNLFNSIVAKRSSYLCRRTARFFRKKQFPPKSRDRIPRVQLDRLTWPRLLLQHDHFRNGRSQTLTPRIRQPNLLPGGNS